MSEDISLDEALGLAERYENSFKSFAKIKQVLAKARQVESQRDTEWAEIEKRTAELTAIQKQAEKASADAVAAHEETIQSIATQKGQALEDYNNEIKELAVRLQAETDAYLAKSQELVTKYDTKSEEINNSITKLQEQEEVLLAAIDVLEKKKADLMAFFEGIAKK